MWLSQGKEKRKTLDETYEPFLCGFFYLTKSGVHARNPTVPSSGDSSDEEKKTKTLPKAGKWSAVKCVEPPVLNVTPPDPGERTHRVSYAPETQKLKSPGTLEENFSGTKVFHSPFFQDLQIDTTALVSQKPGNPPHPAPPTPTHPAPPRPALAYILVCLQACFFE